VAPKTLFFATRKKLWYSFLSGIEHFVGLQV
jgi:hypothetical protein